MSACAIRRWGVTSACAGEPRAQTNPETEAALKRMLAERQRQDVALWGKEVTDTSSGLARESQLCKKGLNTFETK